MNSSPSIFRRRLALHARRAGQTSVEYILVIGFLVVVAVGILTPAGTSIRNLLGGVNTQLQGATQNAPNNGQTVPPSP